MWQQTVFEYSEDRVFIQVQGVWAWVCPEDGELSFTHGTVDALIGAIRGLVNNVNITYFKRAIFFFSAHSRGEE